MYRCSCHKYIRSENPIYRWGYLCTSSSALIRKFREMARKGVPQSDWVSTRSWGSPIVPIAPPKRDGLALNIDTYVDYVDK